VTTATEHFSATDSLPPNAIAIVGLAARFPGADTASSYWRNLRDGVESIVTLSEGDLRAAGVGEHALTSPAYVRRAALLDGITEFDAELFGFTPQSARTMDPQHRLFLQCAWDALTDSGYDPSGNGASVGVYGTSSASGYLLHNLMSHHDPHRIIGQGATFEMINLSLQNDKDYLATRVSHQFDLRGPALSVQTACSSSLVAVHLACQSLLNGECEMALAGAASIRVPHRVGYWHDPGSMVSATGHCRPFDVRADGTIFGSGVAVVVLKPLTAAVDDGDRIHAVIRGSAINNDGSTKMNYAAPNAAGQAEVIAEAHAVADVDAATISYVETHGTGTPLGDPIEVDGLRQAFGLSSTGRPGPCVLGSVKSNIGHLEVAAGMAGLVKAVLCLENRGLPGTLHYTSPNPELHLDRGPFVVHSGYRDWDWPGVRRAGVSSFGVGGTNAHIVLEEAPVVSRPQVDTGPQVLMLSARSAEALQRARLDLATELAEADHMMADVAFTLRQRRIEPFRMAAVVRDSQDAAAVLGAPEHDNVIVAETVPGEPTPPSVAFLFPGQGAQYGGMARGLYESEPVFAEHFDRCARGFAEELNLDVRAEVFDAGGHDLQRTDRAQPALFTVEYALARLVESYGVRPAAVAGHSIGEYTAAAIAGIFDLDTAILAVAARARLMYAAPRGVMVAVAASADAVADHLTPDIDIAAVNDPASCVVAGPGDSIRALQDRLAKERIVARRVRTSHAFHSQLMDAVVPEFAAFLSDRTLAPPRLPMLSNVSGTWLSAGAATDPAAWAHQIRATVRFSDELGELLADPTRVLIEVGPGSTLTASAARHPRWTNGHNAIRLMRHPAQHRSDHDAFLLALGQLWTAGVEVDWSKRSRGHRPQRVSLPGYPFERSRHWVEHAGSAGAGTPAAPTTATNSSAAAPANGDHRTTADGASSTEATLQRLWAQCLGLPGVDRGANFFELGGDSLIAISVASAAANEGLDLTPQDLYENQTVAALTEAVTARYAAGLARRSSDEIVHPPLPPNVAHFLEHGLCAPGRWRVPLLLRLRPDVAVEDVRAVLAAVVDHHDALRLRLDRQGGTWEQRVEAAGQFGDLPTRTLPGDVTAGSTAEREALMAVVDQQIRATDASVTPLSATYVRGAPGGPCYLAMSLHGIAHDSASRDILLTDVFTAFGQRLSGEPIALQPVTTSWLEWSQRCAALATHPAVLNSRAFWQTSLAGATLRVAAPPSGRPSADDLVRVSTVLSSTDTRAVDDARRRLRVPIEEILLGALGRTIAAVAGPGTIAVELAGKARSVLKPDVKLHRTVGWFDTVYPVALDCAHGDEVDAGRLIEQVHETLTTPPHFGIGYGLLRYLYAPTAQLFAAVPPADIFLSYAGAIPELAVPPSGDEAVQFDWDTDLSVREAIPGLGHGIELRAYRCADALHLDWWYDKARVDASLIQSFAPSYAAGVVQLTREALAQEEIGSVTDGLALIDLSSVGEVHAQQ
jgi:phthiocerol/phenolphthiocerol synthesis type-I polyketide synthase E